MVLESNIIDAVYIRPRQSIICSMDSVRLPFSTSIEQTIEVQKAQPVIRFVCATPLGWKLDTSPDTGVVRNMKASSMNWESSPDETAAKGQSSREIIYNLENLRKKGHEE